MILVGKVRLGAGSFFCAGGRQTGVRLRLQWHLREEGVAPVVRGLRITRGWGPRLRGGRRNCPVGVLRRVRAASDRGGE